MRRGGRETLIGSIYGGTVEFLRSKSWGHLSLIQGEDRCLFQSQRWPGIHREKVGIAAILLPGEGREGGEK